MCIVDTYAHMPVFAYNKHTCVCYYVYKHTCIYVSMYDECIYTCMYTRVHVSLCVTNACVHVCVSVSVCVCRQLLNYRVPALEGFQVQRRRQTCKQLWQSEQNSFNVSRIKEQRRQTETCPGLLGKLGKTSRRNTERLGEHLPDRRGAGSCRGSKCPFVQ